jgi:hypothetical protein
MVMWQMPLAQEQRAVSALQQQRRRATAQQQQQQQQHQTGRSQLSAAAPSAQIPQQRLVCQPVRLTAALDSGTQARLGSTATMRAVGLRAGLATCVGSLMVSPCRPFVKGGCAFSAGRAGQPTEVGWPWHEAARRAASTLCAAVSPLPSSLECVCGLPQQGLKWLCWLSPC